jgi:TctA family transporter
MRTFGRLLQILGLILLPLAILFELTKDFGLPFTLRDMLLMLVFGAAAFYLGRMMEGYARP